MSLSVKSVSPRSLSALQGLLGVKFDREQWLETAITHRSYGQPHNERLEFLGDGVLDCVVAATLFDRFPDLPEGDLTRLRAQLVRQDTLCDLAQRLQLGEFLRLGEGERRSGGAEKPSMLADAFEAIIGALFLDSGFAKAASFVQQQYEALIATLDPAKTLKDPKTRLQEWMQARRYPLPTYSVQTIEGVAHAQQFSVRCEVTRPKLFAVGVGSSRRQAEQQAATLLLERLESQPPKSANTQGTA